MSSASAKCGFPGVKSRYSEFRAVSHRRRGGECGLFPAHAASAAGRAPYTHAVRSRRYRGFLGLPGLSRRNQDVHKVGAKFAPAAALISGIAPQFQSW